MLRLTALLALLAASAIYTALAANPVVPEAGSWGSLAIGVVLIAQRRLFRG